jgi:hypothetical protein
MKKMCENGQGNKSRDTAAPHLLQRGSNNQKIPAILWILHDLINLILLLEKRNLSAVYEICLLMMMHGHVLCICMSCYRKEKKKPNIKLDCAVSLLSLRMEDK